MDFPMPPSFWWSTDTIYISGAWFFSFMIVQSFGTRFVWTLSLMCEVVCKINCRFLVAPCVRSSHSIRLGSYGRTIRPLDPTVPQLRLICPFQHHPTIPSKTSLQYANMPICGYINANLPLGILVQLFVLT